MIKRQEPPIATRHEQLDTHMGSSRGLKEIQTATPSESDLGKPECNWDATRTPPWNDFDVRFGSLGDELSNLEIQIC